MSIFVSIASYRDSLISDTIESIFSNAKIKARVFVGVILQNSDNDKESIRSSLLTLYGERIRYKIVDYKEAKGPLYARQLIIEELYRQEDFYLQIDSHTKCYPNWDEKLLDNLFMLNDINHSIITCYPVTFENYMKLTLVPQMVVEEPYQKNPNIKIYKAVMYSPTLKPTETPFLGAGFLFGTKNLVMSYPKVKFPFLFQGEEMLLVYTFRNKGFKFYSPSENIVAHLYYRKDQPKLWQYTDDWNGKEMSSLSNLELYIKGIKI